MVLTLIMIISTSVFSGLVASVAVQDIIDNK